MLADTKAQFRIVIISINNVWRYGNIGADQLAGYLRQAGFNVDVKHYNKKDRPEKIVATLSGQYDFLGFSVTSANLAKCAAIATELKRADKDIYICFGGGLVSRYYREIFSEVAALDYAILGDGEIPCETLLNALLAQAAHADTAPLQHTAVASRHDLAGKKEFINKEINHLPAFDYYLHDSPSRNSRKVHCLQTKNNICTGSCSFCTERHGRIHRKDIEAILTQIRTVHEHFGVKKFFFTDDNLLDPNTREAKLRIGELCEKLKSLPYALAYQCYIKANAISDCEEDRSLLRAMREAGFVEVFVGVESGNDADLLLYNKKTSVENNRRAVRLLKEHGLTPIIGFISFNPYSTRESIAENFRFLCEMECTYLFNYLYSFVVINKYTPLHAKVQQDGLLTAAADEYINLKYAFQNPDVQDILEYVETTMIPRLNQLDYQLDWVTYSFKEHKIWFPSVTDYAHELEQYRLEDAAVIKHGLAWLFLHWDLEKFKSIEAEFWGHFQSREERLKQIYDDLIALHDAAPASPQIP